MDFDYSGNNPPDGSASRLYTTERLAAVPAAIKDFSNGVPGLGGTNGPVLKGQWNELKVHWKPSSAAGVLDGVYQWWVNGTLIHNFSGQDFWNHTSSSETDVKLRAGYFMGSCDSGFLAATSVFLDDLEFYDTNPGWV